MRVCVCMFVSNSKHEVPRLLFWWMLSQVGLIHCLLDVLKIYKHTHSLGIHSFPLIHPHSKHNYKQNNLSLSLSLSPWCNCTGWLGVKHQLLSLSLFLSLSHTHTHKYMPGCTNTCRDKERECKQNKTTTKSVAIHSCMDEDIHW